MKYYTREGFKSWLEGLPPDEPLPQPLLSELENSDSRFVILCPISCYLYEPGDGTDLNHKAMMLDRALTTSIDFRPWHTYTPRTLLEILDRHSRLLGVSSP